ncbi:MAG: hypothetical protein HQ537_02590 [Parcubacteria group bacterium]|nr:hypothetical protein [Parcubacteria group bacterium]
MRTTFYKIQDSLITYFNSANSQNTILVLKIISVIFSFFLLIAIILLIFRIREDIQESLKISVKDVIATDLPKEEMNKTWQAILNKLESENDSDYKLAVIEADKILDDSLKRLGYQGEDMGERLKQIKFDQLSNIDELWQAHKVRNRIAHEPDFQLTQTQAKRAIEIYQRAMQDLKAL